MLRLSLVDSTLISLKSLLPPNYVFLLHWVTSIVHCGWAWGVGMGYIRGYKNLPNWEDQTMKLGLIVHCWVGTLDLSIKINLSILLIASQLLQGQRSFKGWPFLWLSVIANPNDVLKKTRLLWIWNTIVVGFQFWGAMIVYHRFISLELYKDPVPGPKKRPTVFGPSEFTWFNLKIIGPKNSSFHAAVFPVYPRDETL